MIDDDRAKHPASKKTDPRRDKRAEKVIKEGKNPPPQGERPPPTPNHWRTKSKPG